MNILITGVSGFLGSSLVHHIPGSITGVGRKFIDRFNGRFYVKSLDYAVNYDDCLLNQDVVIHCAARVHIMDDISRDPLSDFREINTAGTLNLARQAVDAGVKRFIFISSIKVNGESTLKGSKFTSSDLLNPEDPYGISKHEAEHGLIELSKETGMDLVIIRPTLVYGAGVKGNFLSLLKLCKSGLPLPFGAIHNARSMVYLVNLVDLIITCIDHPNAAGKTFLASDGDDVSLTRLLRLIRQSMSKRALLVPVPVFLFNLLGRLTDKEAVVDRLVGNLQVDSSDARASLGWVPPYTVEQGVKATVDDFMNCSNIKSIKK